MRIARAAVVAGLLLLVGAAPASAHAAYKSSTPPDEGTVSSPPSEVTAEFTEPVTQDSYLQVFDPCGGRVDHGDSNVTGYTITVSMSGAARGTYTVTFTAQSAFDSHITRGSFTFTSTGGDPCPGAEPAPEEQEEEAETERDPGGGSSSAGDGSAGTDAGAGDPAPAGGESRKKMGESGRHARHRASARGASDVLPAMSQASPAPPVPPPTSPEEIPMRGLVIGLSAAALIGAAGGMVYAGLMGPRR